jgi:L-amino acid N-acyltransferase YncA
VTVRAALRVDAPQIAAIWNEVIRTSTITFTTVEKPDDEVARLIAERPCLVAGNTHDIAGFAIYGPFRAGPGYRFTAEHSVYVRREAQGAGHGRALMIALEDHARAAGLRVLVAGIGGENEPAQRFHERLGFREEGRLTGVGEKFGRAQDLILMTKRL